MNEPSRLDLLRFLERVQLGDLQRTRDWITAEEQRTAEIAARRPPAPRPEWLIQRGIDTHRSPVAVHTGDCGMAGKLTLPVTREQALAALGQGVEACGICRPDTELGVLG